MGNVGNVHTEHPAAAHRARDRDGVVEVARVNRIDGQQKAIADIATQGVLERLIDIDAQRLSLVNRRLRIPVRQTVTGHDALDT